jgi:hypothetical protein
MRRRGIVIGVFGVLTIAVGFFAQTSGTVMWSNLLSGLVAAVLGLSLMPGYPGRGGISLLLGLWLFIVAFVPGMRAGGFVIVNNFVSGLILAFAGFTVPPAIGREEPPARRAA